MEEAETMFLAGLHLLSILLSPNSGDKEAPAVRAC